MPFDSAFLNGTLDSAIQSPQFRSLSPDERGLALNSVIGAFQKDYATNSKEDTDAINKAACERYALYKQKGDFPHLILKEDQFKEYFEKLDINRNSNPSDAIITIENWRSASEQKAIHKRPADADDLQLQLRQLANGYIRQVVGAKTSWLADKFYRFSEGFISQPISLIGSEGKERFLAEYFPASPLYDKEPTSTGATICGIAFFYIFLLFIAALISRKWKSIRLKAPL